MYYGNALLQIMFGVKGIIHLANGQLHHMISEVYGWKWLRNCLKRIESFVLSFAGTYG